MNIVEAMAAALPVVTGRSGGVCETVVDGETGFLIKPGDVESHAQALVKLAKSPELRGEMGRRGWERAGHLFTIEREMQELLKILRVDSERE